MPRATNRPAFRLGLLAAAVQIAFTAPVMAQLPTGGQVAAGAVTIAAPVNGAMQVNNLAPSSIVNWQTFSIGAQNAVNIQQLTAGSVLMNRVVGGQMSEILGRLSSNGQVFLINPSGIMIGRGAAIDTAGFVASTLNIQDADFLAGRLRFQGDAGAGAVINQGWIRTSFGGNVALIAPRVENSGLIEAPGGQLLLAAGQKMTIASLEAGGISFEVQAPGDSVLNLGQLIADGGVVRAFAGTLRHGGTLRANALTRDAGGEIVLKAAGDVELAAGSSTVANGATGGTVRIESANGTAQVAGRVEAIGSAGAGGRIDLLGENVALRGNGALDASGAASGGNLRMGGDWQGGNDAIRNARSATVDAGASLTADATARGDGGRIVVWSDRDTRYAGSLSARGGPQGGDGGQAEVSGRANLVFDGRADLGAPAGRAGSLLIDPLDLFVDANGGLNPFIIDQASDFPANAATVTPGTLAAITGSVTLLATRDLRINSAVALTGSGQGLSASAGRNLQLGAGISTNNGAISLSAGSALSTFAATPLASGGGAISVAAPSIAASQLSFNAGSGAVNVSSSAGNLNVGASAAAGSIAIGASAGSATTGALSATGAINVSGATGVSTSAITSNGGAVTLSSPGGNVNAGSIDSRLGGGPTAGAVSINSAGTVNTSAVQSGNANIGMAGSSVTTGTLTTTGSVALTASAGDVNAAVDNALSVSVSSARSNSSTSVTLSSNTVLNATSVSATATNCNSSSSCPGATVTLSGNQGVNVGTVVASAPATTNVAAPFNAISETVTISSTNGSINAISPASQVRATNVTLSTSQGTGGGIGTLTTALNVNNTRTFDFRPNGEFNVLLNGSGPNRLDIQLGVPGAGSYTGMLSKPGQITLNASADQGTGTVTVSNFTVASGFDDLVFNTSPRILLTVPNGNLIATNISMPAGDQTGRVPPGCCSGNIIQTLPVTIQARDDLTITNYTRVSGVQADTLSISSTGTTGSVTLGTINADADAVTVSAPVGVTLQNQLATRGNVNITAATGGADTGNVTIGGLGINTAAGSGTVTINAISALPGQGEVRAATDSVALEITGGGAVTLNARTIGSAGFTNPLDLAAPTVTLATNNAAVGTGTAIGFAGAPVVANTTQLTVTAAACTTSSTLCTGSFRGGTFNVDTGAVVLQNLTVTADPQLVGAGGSAQVTSNGQTWGFASNGTDFTASAITAPGGQFAGGAFNFTALRGNLTLGNIDLSANNGSLNFRTNGQIANLSQSGGDAINLGTGFLTLAADGNVSLQAINARGMSLQHATTNTSSGRSLVGSFFQSGVTSFTTNGQDITDTGLGNGTFSITSRGAVSTGNLDVSGVNFTAMQTGLATGTIGSAARPASSVNLNTNISGAGANVTTGAIEANSLTINARGSIAVGGGTGTINAVNTGASSATLSTSDSGANIGTGAINASSITLTGNGATTVGDLNAAHPSPGSIRFNSTGGSVVTGSLDAGSITSGGNTCCGEPGSITTGTIGGNIPGSNISLSAGTLTVGGPVSLDAASAGNAFLRSSGGLLTIGGAVTGGDGSTIELVSGTAGAQFQFTRIDAGASGTVTVNAAGGMRQTLAAASGGGITGATVSLSSTGAGTAIEGTSPLTVRAATSLTIEAGGSVDITRVDGANPIPLLTNLDISRSDSAAAFSLAGFAAGQSATVTNVAGGVQVAATTPDGAAMRFRYYNTDATNSAITGTGIASKGGEVRLESIHGTVVSGSISSVDPSIGGSGNQVLMSAGTSIAVSGAVDAGAGNVSLSAQSIGGAGSLISTNQVQVTATAGAIGSAGTPLAITSPAATLGTTTDAFAGLTGTNNLQVTANNGFTLTSDTALATLGVTTTAAGTGPLSLTAPGQGFGFTRNGTTVEIGTVSSPSALSSLNFSVTGDLRLLGSGVSSIAADTQTFSASSALHLDGTGARLVLSGNAQTFSSSNSLGVVGAATISASGNQQFSASGALLIQASSGGNIVLDAATQSISGSTVTVAGGAAGESVTASASGSQTVTAGGAGGISLTGGSGTNAPVSFTLNGSGNQSFSASAGPLALAAGTGNQSGVSVTATGSGTQSLFARTNLTLTGDALGATDAPVAIVKNGSSTQTVDADGSILLTGGAGLNGSVRIGNAGSGQQVIGNFFNFSDATDNLTLQGGAGSNASALIDAAGRQLIHPIGALQVRGGTGDGSFARIGTTLATSSGTSMSNATQVVGYNSSFDGSCSGCVSLSSIEVTAGTGNGAIAEIVSAGSQRAIATTTTTLTGSATGGGLARLSALSQALRTGATTLQAGTGNGAHALFTATGGDGDRPSGTTVLQSVDPAALTLNAGGTVGATTATARVASGGSQQIDSNPTVLNAGIGPNAVAEITAVTSQSLSLGTLTLNAAAGGAGATARITAGTSQTGSAGGTTSLTGGANVGASAGIEAGSSQNLSFGNLTLTGGSAQDTRASIVAASGQTLNASTTSLTGGTGTAAGDAAALIRNSGGAQSITIGNLTIRSGADFAAAGILNAGTTQAVSAGAINITTSAGANGLAGSGPFGNGYFAGIVNNAGTQTIGSSSLTVNNVDAAGPIGIVGPAQVFNASGAVTVQAAAGAARLDSGSTQTFNASNGSLTILAASGAGSARVSAVGAQSVTTRFVDISTGAAATGNAELTAGGAQSIHTLNGTVAAHGSLRVAALGTGTAKLESGGAQLLEVDYPELMQSARDGRITVGNAAALGNSVIRAPHQDVFARSLTVLGGAGPGANSKVDVSGVQNISLVRSVSTATAAGVSATGGAGGSALIDPTIQNILSAGPIAVAGGSGPGTVGGIVATGDQTILVTSTGASSIAISGGSGSNAFGHITTTGAGSTQIIGTSGGLMLTAGTGSNADAVIGAGFGNGQSFFACGIGFTCNVPNLPTNPFLSATADFGGFTSSQLIPLSGAAAAGLPAGGEAAPRSSPFDPTILTLWTLNLVDTGEEEDSRLGRLLPVCR